MIQILRSLYVDLMQSKNYRELWHYLNDLEKIIKFLECEE